MTKSRNLIAPRRAWSDFELAVMRMHYPNTIAGDLAELFNRPVYSVYAKAKKLGLEKSPEFLASPASGRTGHDERGQGGQFRPGIVPKNKGKKFPGRTSSTSFQKGRAAHEARNYLPIGSLKIADGGYLVRKVTDDPTLVPARRWVAVHRLLWIEANGPIPDGHVITFKPGTRTTVLEEIVLENLECISLADNCRRNSFHNHGPEIAKVVQLRGAITRQINKRLKESQ